MNFIELRPNWFYSYVNIPNLEQIQNEMRVISDKKVLSANRTFNSYYTNVFKTDLEEKDYPVTVAWLKSVGLYTKFFRLLLSQEKTTGPIVHVDTIDPSFCNSSLNIPLDHCSNTYTGFYKTDKPHLLNSAFPKERQNSNAGWLDIAHAVEVCRVETVRPVLVNTTILHRAISEEPKRTICCFRFLPSLTVDEVKRLGVSQPFIQVD